MLKCPMFMTVPFCADQRKDTIWPYMGKDEYNFKVSSLSPSLSLHRNKVVINSEGKYTN